RSLVRRGIPDLVMVTTEGRREYLAERGIESEWVPLGWVSRFGRPLGRQRDIDVLFLGARNVPRRRQILRRLARNGLRVVEEGDWNDPACWGEPRVELLNRARILLNLARTPGEMSGLRLILGMANQALVVSEPIYRPAPFVAGEHFVSATMEEIPEVISRYLKQDQARQAIVESAFRFVTQEVTLENSARRIVELIRHVEP
ncbi:MAG: glycosyltransferase family protein, partial [Bryobacteraceae bacterium]